MLDIFENLELYYKFVNILDWIVLVVRFFRKFGLWLIFYLDFVLVWGKEENRKYILVVLIDDLNGE